MRRTKLVRVVEEKFGLPLVEVLPKVYKEKGLEEGAKELGVSSSTFWYWLLSSGFVVEKRLVKRG